MLIAYTVVVSLGGEPMGEEIVCAKSARGAARRAAMLLGWTGRMPVEGLAASVTANGSPVGAFDLGDRRHSHCRRTPNFAAL